MPMTEQELNLIRPVPLKCPIFPAPFQKLNMEIKNGKKLFILKNNRKKKTENLWVLKKVQMLLTIRILSMQKRSDAESTPNGICFIKINYNEMKTIWNMSKNEIIYKNKFKLMPLKRTPPSLPLPVRFSPTWRTTYRYIVLNGQSLGGFVVW